MNRIFGRVIPAYRLLQALYFDLFGAQYLPAAIVMIALGVANTGIALPGSAFSAVSDP